MDPEGTANPATEPAPDPRIAQLEAQLAELTPKAAAADATAAALRTATARYRDAVLAANPAIPGRLVAGESIEQIDASVASAREIVDELRATLTPATTPPPPAPPSAPAGATAPAPDWHSMSPTQRIASALRTPNGKV